MLRGFLKNKIEMLTRVAICQEIGDVQKKI
jgi:hypothetical protein